MNKTQSACARASLALAGLPGTIGLAHVAMAQPATNALPVGSCIVAYGASGRIVDKVQGGYRMLKDGDPDKIQIVVSGSSATPSACAGAATPVPAAAPPRVAGAPTPAGGLAMGACVTAYGNSGRIVGSVQNGYRIAADSDPTGTPFVAPASDTRVTACGAFPADTAPRRAGARAAAPAPATQAPAGAIGPGNYAGNMARMIAQDKVDAANAVLKNGKYECRAGGQYTFTDLYITGPQTYEVKPGGKGAFSYANGALTFKSGPYSGAYSRMVDGKTIGVSSKGNTNLGTQCEFSN